ncbi:MAG TPA: DNA mismatch repair endonuclease MutL [Bacillota bacterium]|nr:DNA mismatch repair endonuclease MutL [Bacillota bacterium]HPZ60248.1 DNA mismatch repair endonuclease MutL [Bacillota bacterium]
MLQNSEIRLLPAEISEKIAAGEVVDRPLSVTKELVENSVDAGADTVVLEIKNGGKTYIRVTDNGVGIPPGDVEKAFQRHATSKISRAEDLESIHTLGFRGEALTSIAAVSKVEMITKTASEKMGARIVLEGGQVLECGPVGCPDGTTIIVTDLFYNTPARLKFMKADGTEASLIIDFLSKIALAYPHIRFRMINNGAVLFATRGTGSIYNNILTIYSKQIGEKLIEIDETEGEYRLQAFISPPDVTRPNRRGQVYFVNGRNVSNRVLETAVATAYRERMPDGRNPLVYLFLQVPSNRVDVNIHPNKREVRFADNEEVSQFVINALRKGLQSKEGIPVLQMQDPFRKVPVSEEQDGKNTSFKTSDEQVDIKSILSTTRLEKEDGLSKSAEIGRKEEPSYNVTEDTSNYPEKIADRSNLASYTAPYENPPEVRGGKLDFTNLKPLGSIFATYIIAVDEDHFYLIDQHAAHERVFYEKLLKQFEREEKNTQLLLSPVIVETTPAISNNAEQWIAKLVEMGFIIELFGVKSFIVKGVPSFMELRQAENFLEGFLGEIETTGSIIDENKLRDIIMKACKSAIKANDALTLEEIKHLLSQLSLTENPFSCPHGRPTLRKLSLQDIERLFKRT